MMDGWLGVAGTIAPELSPIPPGGGGMASPAFVAAARQAWDQVYTMAKPETQSIMSRIYLEAQGNPTPEQLAAVGARAGQTLLGLFVDMPGMAKPALVLFEGPLVRKAQKEGSALIQEVRETLYHEVGQHALGLNHVLEKARGQAWDSKGQHA